MTHDRQFDGINTKPETARHGARVLCRARGAAPLLLTILCIGTLESAAVADPLGDGDDMFKGVSKAADRDVSRILSSGQAVAAAKASVQSFRFDASMQSIDGDKLERELWDAADAEETRKFAVAQCTNRLRKQLRCEHRLVIDGALRLCVDDKGRRQGPAFALNDDQRVVLVAQYKDDQRTGRWFGFLDGTVSFHHWGYRKDKVHGNAVFCGLDGKPSEVSRGLDGVVSPVWKRPPLFAKDPKTGEDVWVSPAPAPSEIAGLCLPRECSLQKP